MTILIQCSTIDPQNFVKNPTSLSNFHSRNDWPNRSTSLIVENLYRQLIILSIFSGATKIVLTFVDKKHGRSVGYACLIWVLPAVKAQQEKAWKSTCPSFNFIAWILVSLTISTLESSHFASTLALSVTRELQFVFGSLDSSHLPCNAWTSKENKGRPLKKKTN